MLLRAGSKKTEKQPISFGCLLDGTVSLCCSHNLLPCEGFVLGAFFVSGIALGFGCGLKRAKTVGTG
jgi:hypothetical protein